MAGKCDAGPGGAERVSEPDGTLGGARYADFHRFTGEKIARRYTYFAGRAV